MTKEVPSLKSRPEWLPWALRCINENAGDYRAMENCIVSMWQKVSQRNKMPSVKNSLRAVFGPTLRHLQLITGEGDNIKLLAKGLELLCSHEKEGEFGFKKAYGKHLLKLDRDIWANLTEELRQFDNPVSEQQFIAHLRTKYPGSDLNGDKLRKFLSHLEYAGLISRDTRGVQVRELLLRNLLQNLEVILPDGEFFESLHKAYQGLLARTGGSPYVPIPEVRDKVCRETGMWPTDFDKALALIPKETQEYLIHLSEPMLRQSGGIRLGDKYVYYIAIYKRGPK